MTYRMLPPYTHGTITYNAVRGDYAPMHGRAVDVHEDDVAALVAQEWIAVAPSGSVYERPDNPKAGDWFVDKRDNALFFDGNAWRSVTTGLAQ